MQNSSVIIRVVDPSIRRRKLNRLVGDIRLSSFIDVISAADLEANPRAAKTGDVTDAIEESLEKEADIFEFLTKGVLVAARKVEELERDRFRLTFEDPALEGILDGGHNTLAAGKWVLRKVLAAVLEDAAKADAIVNKIKRWEDFQRAWSEHKEKIEERKGEFKDVLIPLEVIFPTEDAEGQAEFQDRILKINAARNNNAELTEETKANKRGHYDEIRLNLDKLLQDQVEWKTNDGGRIKVRDLVSLALIPLSKLDGDKYAPAKRILNGPSVIFSSKGQCVTLFNELLEDVAGVTAKVKGDIVKIEDPAVRSALALMKDFPELFDLAYEQLPDAYNKASPGFGRISGVKIYDPEKAKQGKEGYLRTRPKTRFYQRELDYSYGEGFVYPVLWGLSSILEMKDGELQWVTEPKAFLKKHLPAMMKSYYALIQGMDYDPAKVGKSNGAYNLAFEMFKGAYRDQLLEKLAAAE